MTVDDTLPVQSARTVRAASDQRRAIVLVDLDFLVNFAKRGGVRGSFLVERALPPDTQVLYAFVDRDTPRAVCLVVHSSEFAWVAEGDDLPILDPPRWVSVARDDET